MKYFWILAALTVALAALKIFLLNGLPWLIVLAPLAVIVLGAALGSIGYNFWKANKDE